MGRKSKYITCVFCKHFCFSLGTPDYSDYTPGEDASLSCDKEYWDIRNYEDDCERKFREALKLAQTCKEFVLNE